MVLGARGIPGVTTQELPEGGVEKEERMILMLIGWLRICREEISRMWDLEVGAQVWGYGTIMSSSRIVVRKIW